MIRNFRNKGLKELFEAGKTKRINKQFHERLLIKLDALDAAEEVEDLDLAGFNFHALTGFKPKRYTIHVNGNCCLTFTFEDGHAGNVDFEDYH